MGNGQEAYGENEEITVIKNVVFDVCDVLLEFDCLNFVYEVFADKKLATAVKNAFIEFDLWNKFDMGPESEEKVVDELMQAYPAIAQEIKFAIYESPKYQHRFWHAIPWIKELKAQGFKVFIISNYCRLMINARPDTIDFVPELDGGFFSCDVHMIKPHADIFAKLCADYGVKPEECVFVDDRPANVEAAKALGFEGLVFKNYASAHAQLRGILNY